MENIIERIATLRPGAEINLDINGEIKDWPDDRPQPTDSELSAVVCGTLAKQKELRSARTDALQAITHDFEDGRVIQVRPSDVGNIQISISLGIELEWVMADNTVALLTPAELQAAFDAGVHSAKVVWDDYMTALKAI